eukprot:5599314-Pyramimonas_sp.AAC.1
MYKPAVIDAPRTGLASVIGTSHETNHTFWRQRPRMLRLDNPMRRGCAQRAKRPKKAKKANGHLK